MSARGMKNVNPPTRASGCWGHREIEKGWVIDPISYRKVLWVGRSGLTSDEGHHNSPRKRKTICAKPNSKHCSFQVEDRTRTDVQLSTSKPSGRGRTEKFWNLEKNVAESKDDRSLNKRSLGNSWDPFALVWPGNWPEKRMLIKGCYVKV